MAKGERKVMRVLRVLLQPIGKNEWQLLTKVALLVPQFLPFAECQVAPKSLPLPPGFVTPRRQWLADGLLAQLLVPNGYDRVVGVTEVDLVVPPLNFVFGLAEKGGKRAIVSVARLKDRHLKRTEERLLKEVLHELGHTFGLGHCQDPNCVEAFSNTLADTDRKGPGFCPRCLQRIWTAWQQEGKELLGGGEFLR
ncbi:MAG: hypothetical protein IMHGJWDQ_000047 [Candidatus Fervidibacter sp.]|mgnify:CR=1 FL=1